MSKASSSPPPSPKIDKAAKEAQQPNAVTASKSAPPSSGPGGEDVLLFLLASRLLNALVLQTFFQPDEYFQSLEPGWELAFGSSSGAWITWASMSGLAQMHIANRLGRNGGTTCALQSILPSSPSPTEQLTVSALSLASALNCGLKPS